MINVEQLPDTIGEWYKVPGHGGKSFFNKNRNGLAAIIDLEKSYICIGTFIPCGAVIAEVHVESDEDIIRELLLRPFLRKKRSHGQENGMYDKKT